MKAFHCNKLSVGDIVNIDLTLYHSMQECVDLVKVLLAITVMLIASRQDWRERMADDIHWAVMGLTGLAFMALHVAMEGLRWEYYLIIIATAVLFLDIFWDNDGMGRALTMSPYAFALILLGAAIGVIGLDGMRYELLSPFILYWIFVLLYMFDIIKGGADAKCLIALALLFPLYPGLWALPLLGLPVELAQLLLPFPLMVLFLASVLSIAILPYFLVRNIVRGDIRFPQSLLGTRIPMDNAEKGHYWPMERVREDGGVEIRSSPQGEGFEALRQAGAEMVWVTPKIPLLIPMTAALLILIVLGNPLFILL